MNGKTLLVEAQKEMTNMLLETEGKSLSYGGRKLAELCPLFVWKAKVVSDELRCLTEAISRQYLRRSLVYYCCPW